ncbi:multidrug effflux MFS transporter [Seohaeicola nanhaiensis]|uniref:Bcr/CflA family efflux transporter n=1 Tax=Seohaeicola nanhaiensis TaxID=1387282 RepID=A0ABV9KCT8_9RHOB
MTVPRPVRFLDRRTPPHVATLVLLTGMSALSMNIFLPSLPGMTAYFHTEYSVMQLSVALFLLFNAILQIGIGPISDSRGRRPVILWGIALFLLATLGCIYAPTAELFLVARMCQAVIAVAMVLTRAAVRDLYTQDKAASMIGYVTMGMAVVPMASPAVGGLLDGIFGWQANFWLLFIFGAMSLALAYFDFGETAVRSGKSLGAQVRDYPELLRSPRFWGYTLAAAFSSGSFYAYLGGAPYVGTVVYGMNPTELGVYFGAPAIGYFTGNFITARLAARVGVNRMVLAGGLLIFFGVGLSMIVMTLGYGSAETFFGFMVFIGVGNGLTIANGTAGALSVRPHLAGTASGLSGAIMLGGGAGLSALAGLLLTPGSGAMPLLWIMIITAAASVVSIVLVMRREKRLRL